MPFALSARTDVVTAFALAFLSTFTHHPLGLLLLIPVASLTVRRWGPPTSDALRNLRLKCAIWASLTSSGAMSGRVLYLGVFGDLGSGGTLCAVWLASVIALYSVWYVSILVNTWWGAPR